MNFRVSPWLLFGLFLAAHLDPTAVTLLVIVLLLM